MLFYFCQQGYGYVEKYLCDIQCSRYRSFGLFTGLDIGHFIPRLFVNNYKRALNLYIGFHKEIWYAPMVGKYKIVESKGF